MTEESKGKPIGGLGRQYKSVGGKSAQAFGPSEGQAPKPSDAQVSKYSNAQPSSTLDAQEPKRKREKQTVYLDHEVSTWIRHRIADTREEISDVINKAVRSLMAQNRD